MAESVRREADAVESAIPEFATPSDRLMTADSVFLPTISVVFPTVGTADQLIESVVSILEMLEAYEVTGEVIVCLPESDRRADVAREMGAIIANPDRPGYGASLGAAFEQLRGTYVAIGEATGAYDFGQLPSLFGELEQGADLVIGSRLAGEVESGAISGTKRFLSMPLMSGFLNVFYGAGVSDPDSGLLCFHHGILDQIAPNSDSWQATYAMIRDAAEQGLHLTEVPVTYRHLDGVATTESTGWDYLLFGLKNVPPDGFTAPGLVMGVVGAVLMAVSFFELELTMGTQPLIFGNRTMLAGSLLVLIGHQTANVGAFASVSADGSRSTRDQLTRQLLASLNGGRAITLALAVFGFGALYSAWMLVTLLSSGGLPREDFTTDLLAMTAILLGIQIAVTTVLIEPRRES